MDWGPPGVFYEFLCLYISSLAILQKNAIDVYASTLVGTYHCDLKFELCEFGLSHGLFYEKYFCGASTRLIVRLVQCRLR